MTNTYIRTVKRQTPGVSMSELTVASQTEQIYTMLCNYLTVDETVPHNSELARDLVAKIATMIDGATTFASDRRDAVHECNCYYASPHNPRQVATVLLLVQTSFETVAENNLMSVVCALMVAQRLLLVIDGDSQDSAVAVAFIDPVGSERVDGGCASTEALLERLRAQELPPVAAVVGIQIDRWEPPSTRSCLRKTYQYEACMPVAPSVMLHRSGDGTLSAPVDVVDRRVHTLCELHNESLGDTSTCEVTKAVWEPLLRPREHTCPWPPVALQHCRSVMFRAAVGGLESHDCEVGLQTIVHMVARYIMVERTLDAIGGVSNQFESRSDIRESVDERCVGSEAVDFSTFSDHKSGQTTKKQCVLQ